MTKTSEHVDCFGQVYVKSNGIDCRKKLAPTSSNYIVQQRKFDRREWVSNSPRLEPHVIVNCKKKRKPQKSHSDRVIKAPVVSTLSFSPPLPSPIG